MVITLDINSVAGYKSGPLIKLCLDYLGRSPEQNPTQSLSANSLNKDNRMRLAKYLRNVKVRSTGIYASKVHSIKDVSVHGADSLRVKTEDREISVAVSTLCFSITNIS